jgi:small subunit ribosomal protein S13
LHENWVFLIENTRWKKMLYLLGINLPDQKLVHIALTSIYGIGRAKGLKICNQLEIHPQCRLSDLSEAKITKLSQLLNTIDIEAELRRTTQNRITSLISMGAYRGTRHAAGKPTRGQRTRNNASTAKMLNGRWLKEGATRAFSTLRRAIH